MMSTLLYPICCPRLLVSQTSVIIGINGDSHGFEHDRRNPAIFVFSVTVNIR